MLGYRTLGKVGNEDRGNFLFLVREVMVWASPL